MPFHAVHTSSVLRACAAALAAAVLLALPTTASAAPRVDDASTQTVKAAQRALGVRADGVIGPKTRRAIRRHQREEGLRVDGVLGPRTLRSLGVIDGDDPPGADDGTPPAPSGDAAATLERIAQCESGGDPTAVSAGGVHRGKYQFDRETWEALGGIGDPAEAPEAEQDARAAQLLAQRGTAPWPACAG